ncbi:MAG: glutamate-5-semialdehyde dehydrogenase [Bacillota bacterium]|nr:glutamate-5-semialdehyde dehydrogenase [Bacillota bacterium]
MKLATLAKEAAPKLAQMGENEKNRVLLAMADMLERENAGILAANKLDVDAAAAKGQTRALIDRLTLDEERISAMAIGLRDVAALPDPIGEVISMWQRPNGLRIGKMRVPLGVIGMIYEARPNVTVDSAGLCIKSGNAVVLRGGSEAIHSNTAIVEILNKAGKEAGLPEGALSLITDTSREAAKELMQLCGIIDVLIPRGGAGLIRSVIENARVPVIETGVGNCHVYVDGDCDEKMAVSIVVNAKTSRPAVCNAAETLLVDEKIARTFLPVCIAALREKGVEIRGCKKTRAIVPDVKEAVEQDWYEEYLDYIMAVKVVSGVKEAIAHINKYGTKHSEAIVTKDYFAAQRFLREVDAAAVYVNASTRFTDGYEFGFGAEIGISTQKLHARGPMGLKELTTIKYIIYGEGQIR